MSTKTIDIINPPPTTELEEYLRWKEHLHARLTHLSPTYRKITVK